MANNVLKMGADRLNSAQLVNASSQGRQSGNDCLKLSRIGKMNCDDDFSA